MQQNVAYDLNKFANRSPERRMRVQKGEDKKAIRRFKLKGVRTVMLICVMSFLLGSLLYSQSISNELTSKINDIEKTCAEAMSEHTYLANEMQMKTNISNIEQQAAALGLVKMDKSQITYITLAQENKIVRPENNLEKTSENLRSGLMSFMEYLAP